MQKQLKLFRALTSIFMAGIFIGLLFKLMHWPHGSFIFLISSIGFSIFLITSVILKPNRNLNDYFRIGIGVFWVSSTANKFYHYFQDYSILTILFWICIIGFLITKNKGAKKSKKDLFLTISSTIAVVFILLGALFKLMHWPFAAALLILGFVFLTIRIIIGVFIDTEEEKPNDEIDKIGKL